MYQVLSIEYGSFDFMWPLQVDLYLPRWFLDRNKSFKNINESISEFEILRNVQVVVLKTIATLFRLCLMSGTRD